MGPHAHIRSLPPEGEQGLPWDGPAGGLGPHAHIRSLPPEGAERRGSMPACAGMDGTRRRCVSQRRGLQGQGLPWDGPAGGLAASA